jgi:hypothetical protein
MLHDNNVLLHTRGVLCVRVRMCVLTTQNETKEETTRRPLNKTDGSIAKMKSVAQNKNGWPHITENLMLV